MSLAWKPAWVLWTADESCIDAESWRGVMERSEHGGRRCVKPSVDALGAGPNDGGELPVENFTNPPNEGKRSETVFFDFRWFLGFDAIETVEVENHVWSD